MGQIFLSHVDEDGRVVQEIAAGLEREGFSTWYYERDAVTGVPHPKQTREAIRQADAVAVLISSQSLGDSKYVWPELRRAVIEGKHRMPLLLDVPWKEVEEDYPDWDDALGGAVAVPVPRDRPAEILPKFLAGLQMLGIKPQRAGKLAGEEEPRRVDNSPTRIFVCYRRADAPEMSEKIYGELARHFRRSHIFRDISHVAPGLPWEKAIDEAVGSCDVFLVLIGNRWLDATDENGDRRLDDPRDRHRREIEIALEREIRLIPVLVDDAQMPTYEDLPETLRRLYEIQAFRITELALAYDMERLIDVIERLATQLPWK